MDSGNSGSLQSSSGGDDEYDSRAAGGFLNGGRVSNPQFFDPVFDYLQQDKGLRSSGVVMPMFSGSGAQAAPMMSGRTQAGPGVDVGGSADEPLSQAVSAARNPKKRSRASRRAPTTVLTTDTANFRAMVQEFTGIPSLSFSNSSFSRRRLDLFATRPEAAPPPYFRQLPLPRASFPATHHGVMNAVSVPDSTPSSSTSFFTPNLPNFTQSPPFPCLVQSNQRFPFPISPLLCSKSDLPPLSAPSKMTFFDEQFSLSHDAAASATSSNHQSLIFSGQLPLQGERNDNRVEKDSSGEYAFLRDTPASTSTFSGGKGPENTGRDGAIGSWVCSSQ